MAAHRIKVDALEEPVVELGMSFPFEANHGKNWAEAK